MNADSFPAKLIARFQDAGQEQVFPKGGLILREGEIERNVYYIISGAVRVIYLSEFEEQTIRFGYEGSIINSLSSFVRERPSEFYIEAMRKTILKTLSKASFLELVHQSPENLRQYTIMLEEVITQQVDRETDLLTPSPSERLKRVLARSPNLFQEVPLKYIASYLRMTPETLSRIRNS